MGFRGAMRVAQPQRSLVEVTDSDGLDATQRDLVLEALERDEGIVAVYSMGGGNLATLDAFDALGRTCAVFIAHDLDHDNTRLLCERRLSAVLHHDLRQDVRRACQTVMRAHKALPDDGPSLPSAIQVVTPYNMPPGISPLPFAG
jgi:LacI family transcriptional regulator